MTSQRKKINKVNELKHFSGELDKYLHHVYWHEKGGRTERQATEALELRKALLGYVGRFKGLITELTGKDKVTIATSRKGLPVEEYSTDMWVEALKLPYGSFTREALLYCIDATWMAVGKLELDIEQGTRDEQGNQIQEPLRIAAESPKAFIVHGGETDARNRLQRFLLALGVQPLIIEEEPKEGRSVNQQVEHYSRMADCAILLGTGDDKELKDGKLYPRRNDFIEIGRFLEKFPMRIIYLQEEGASFPSIIAEKLRTPFTQDSMDEAFIVIARELKAFGVLEAAKPAKGYQS